MVQSLTLLLVCQLAGEALARLTGLPLPGPIVGMGLLFVVLTCWRRPPERLGVAADGLLEHLSLLFVPAALGIIDQRELLARHGLTLAAAVVVSTLLTMVVTGLVFKLAARRWPVDAEPAASDEQP